MMLDLSTIIDQAMKSYGESPLTINIDCNTYLLEKIEELENRVKTLAQTIGPRQIPDEYAELEIVEFIRQRKSMGKSTIDMLDFMQALNLPSDQIDRIMEKLKKKGVKEYE